MKEEITIAGETETVVLCDMCGVESESGDVASVYLPTDWVEVDTPASDVRRDIDLCRDCTKELFSLIDL